MSEDAWTALAAFTPARVALGRAGSALPTRRVLEFQLAHARARDAVNAPFDAAALAQELGALCLTTQAADRTAYLVNPDLGRRLSKARLDELVEEALVDAYGESEQATGFYSMIENDLCLPFETEMLGVTVTVESIDITEDDQLVAVCRKGKHRQRISLTDLPLPKTLPEGSEWIVAYRYWRTGAM